MTTAVFTPAYIDKPQAASKLSVLAQRFMSAMIESRARTAAQELRRHEALMADLGRRQDHSPLFLTQDNDLPFRV
jgi:hypothetical protein